MQKLDLCLNSEMVDFSSRFGLDGSIMLEHITYLPNILGSFCVLVCTASICNYIISDVGGGLEVFIVELALFMSW